MLQEDRQRTDRAQEHGSNEETQSKQRLRCGVEALRGAGLRSWDNQRLKLENQPHRSASVERRRSGMLLGKGAVTNFKSRWIFAMTDGEKSISV